MDEQETLPREVVEAQPRQIAENKLAMVVAGLL